MAQILGSDSGSDFEQDLKKKNPKMSSSSSSSDASENEVSNEDNENNSDEEIHKENPKSKKKGPKTFSKKLTDATRSSMKNREHLLERTANKNAVSKSNGGVFTSPYFKKQPSSNSIPDFASRSLSLSESSSSEDENFEKSSKKPTFTKMKSPMKKKSPMKPSTSILSPKNESMSLHLSDEEEEVDFSAHLASIAKSQEIMNEPTKDKQKPDDVKPSPKKSSSSSIVKNDDIANLLAKGEGVAMDNLSDDDTEDKVKVEDENYENQAAIGTEPIQIELPHENAIRKRKKKGFDVEAWVRRELGRAQRELQMLKHQTHVLCLIGHLKFLNSFAAFPPVDHDAAQMCLASAMSVIPNAHYVHGKDLDLIRLSAFLGGCSQCGNL